MIPQTIIVAVVFTLVALSQRRSGNAIGLLIVSTLIWPEYLRIPTGFIEISVPRLVAFALILKAFVGGKNREITTCRADRLVFMLWVWTILASIIAGSPFAHTTQMIGRGLDTVLMYFVVRFYIVSSDDLVYLSKWLAFTLLVMSTLGVLEAVTGNSPYEFTASFKKIWIEKDVEFRQGLRRASASTSSSIFFGMAMMILTGIYLAIQRGILQHRFGWTVIVVGLAGVLSCMSSGPWLGSALIFAMGLFSYKPNLIRPALFAILLAFVMLEIASNRHFYNLIDYLALDSHTAWYRTRLMEIAVSRLFDYWLVGVGGDWPHHWANLLDGRDHIDVVNHFIIVALYGGLPAMFMYIATHYIAVSRIVALWKTSGANGIGLTAFFLAAVLLALDFSSLSVGLFGPPLLLSNVLLALAIGVTDLKSPNIGLPVAQHHF